MISVLLFVLALLVPSTSVHAQEAAAQCTPACASNYICVYIGSGSTQTECIPAEQNGTADEVVVTASKPASTGTLKDIVNNSIIPLGNEIVALLMALAFLLFIFGVFRFFFVQGVNGKGRAEGRNFIIWSIIALTVLFSVWGLVRLVMGILPGT